MGYQQWQAHSANALPRHTLQYICLAFLHCEGRGSGLPVAHIQQMHFLALPRHNNYAKESNLPPKMDSGHYCNILEVGVSTMSKNGMRYFASLCVTLRYLWDNYTAAGVVQCSRNDKNISIFFEAKHIFSKCITSHFPITIIILYPLLLRYHNYIHRHWVQLEYLHVILVPLFQQIILPFPFDII